MSVLISDRRIPSFLPEESTLKPLTDYEDYVSKIRKLAIELGDEIKNNVPPLEAMENYNRKLEDLQDEFINIRLNDYHAVRKVEQMGLVEANHEGTNHGSPRHTSYTNVVYDAPDGMVFDTYTPGITSTYGDCHDYFNILDGGKNSIFN
ncbi:hypothetical protein [Paenibacillus sp. IHB B 3084]|uniref:hypothetical protein n=1 Tax=Paenibacillus sp. IHB B 3084 TaxID=867076 RepID=UPI000A860E7C|nr:hypothetical protein [Paenibacillus sp. IHB B 3084]